MNDAIFRYYYLPWGIGLLVMVWVLAIPTKVPCSSDNSLVDGAQDQPTAPITPAPPVRITSAYFPGCENVEGKEKADCSKRLMYDYVYRNTAYPAGKPIHKTAGIVVVSFLVTTQGTIKDVQLSQEPRREQGLDVLRIIEKMGKDGIRWEPATADGVPISQRVYLKVQYNMVWAGSNVQPPR